MYDNQVSIVSCNQVCLHSTSSILRVARSRFRLFFVAITQPHYGGSLMSAGNILHVTRTSQSADQSEMQPPASDAIAPCERPISDATSHMTRGNPSTLHISGVVTYDPSLGL